jgi:hypothetical protein
VTAKCVSGRDRIQKINVSKLNKALKTPSDCPLPVRKDLERNQKTKTKKTPIP